MPKKKFYSFRGKYKKPKRKHRVVRSKDVEKVEQQGVESMDAVMGEKVEKKLSKFDEVTSTNPGSKKKHTEILEIDVDEQINKHQKYEKAVEDSDLLEEQESNKDFYSHISNKANKVVGSRYWFSISVLIVVVWLLAGVMIGYGDTWQQIIHTITSVVTLLMMALLHASQLKWEERMVKFEGHQEKILKLLEEDTHEIMHEIDKLDDLFNVEYHDVDEVEQKLMDEDEYKSVKGFSEVDNKPRKRTPQKVVILKKDKVNSII